MSLRDVLHGAEWVSAKLISAIERGLFDVRALNPIWSSTALRAALAQRQLGQEVGKSYQTFEILLKILSKKWHLAGEYSASHPAKY